jgi:hypothetical protein
VAVAAVGVLAVVAFRPSGGSSGTGAARSPVTSRPTATVDPRVDQVKAVARAYLEAFWDSAKTGDTSTVDALTEKDSQAYSNAALAARISKDDHHTFAANRVDVDEASWRVDLTTSLATVRLAYRLYGHEADWPSLRPREPDRLTPAYTVAFQMEIMGARWIIYKSS